MTLRLTRRFAFEMAHALPLYEGKCHNLHGHSYKLYVTVETSGEWRTESGEWRVENGEPHSQFSISKDSQFSAPLGMVMDFSAIKRMVEESIVERFDHALVLPPLPDGTTPPTDQLGGYVAKVIVVPFAPTTENLLLHFAQLLEGKMPSGVRLYSLKLYETENSCAELIL